MKISEAKDIIIKREICSNERLQDRCKNNNCDGCIFDYDISLEDYALEFLRDYYIKKHVKAQKKDFMLEVREARLRKKVE